MGVINYYKNKTYKIPINISDRSTHKYQLVIDKGYAKYLDIINLCDKVIMYNQFYALVRMFDNLKESSSHVKGHSIIKELERAGFVRSMSLNKNKFFYLSKPSLALLSGDYNCTNIKLDSALKNDKFTIALLKNEYFIKTNCFLHSSIMFFQLKNITLDIYKLIIANNNNFSYDLDAIKHILTLDKYTDILSYLSSIQEWQHKLGIIRDLWTSIGSLYNNMIKQRQTILEPSHLKYYVNPSSGEVLLHYVINIVVFDVNHDKKFYKDKIVNLFNFFYSMPNNHLMGLQNIFEKTRGKSMGYEFDNHIAYKLTIIGYNKDIIEEKRDYVYSLMKNNYKNINISNSPLLGAETIYIDINRFINCQSRLSNIYSKKYDDMLDSIILKKLKELNNE